MNSDDYDWMENDLRELDERMKNVTPEMLGLTPEQFKKAQRASAHIGVFSDDEKITPEMLGLTPEQFEKIEKSEFDDFPLDLE